MSRDALEEFVEAQAKEFGIPGVAVGVWMDGRELTACHGVTSIDNPLPVDRETLFVLGSVTKTYTATAIMRLVEEGRVELDAPVRRYVPELRLPDEDAAARITLLSLLNHTAGLDTRMVFDSGDGDDALASEVAQMAEVALVGPVGGRASYSQLGYNLLGRVIENVTGETYEAAVAALVLEPAGLDNSVFTAGQAITRRFAVGHNLADGTLKVARTWKDTRGNNPGGGLASSVSDQLRWARFHLGGGDLARRMQEPTVELHGSTLGDAIGLGWFLRDVDGVRTVGHGGSTNGQFADLLLVPERDFAVVAVSNAGPDNGLKFNQAVIRWALEHYLGVAERDPEPLPYDPQRAQEITGHYENEFMTLIIDTDGDTMTLECRIKPEIRAAAERELPADLPPAGLGLLPGSGDVYIVTGGGLIGQRGFLTRDADGAIIGADLAGRYFSRVPTPGE
ncbi:serine hydrolase domain-containing protein [Kitasatospora sp. DSM 101779]|uniref:serine hydrolase domain-containing protein n=1 Tax=Kitasatospora sp. DSM 101779 TaxID=2853165 RepID=UPI0021D95E46|nr:serine hydrolase domain-containing protein [Kitasatospora sp. DSM 101779]MCU7827235.1 beta-lactamase family protein [Kitasatospora sp. DSM 101779]